jgi:hypothetical protein
LSTKTVCPNGCGKEWIGTSSRRADTPLDPDATAAADEASAANCARLKNPDGTSRNLTMSDDDYYCRRVWMDAYLAALEKKKGKKTGPSPTMYPDEAVVPCLTANLVVQVTDFNGKPVKDALVTVKGVGEKATGDDGLADFGEVPPKQYVVDAEKNNYRPDPPKDPNLMDKMAPGPAEKSADVPACQTTLVVLQLDPLEVILRENIIFIGSEEDYDLFWLKMMFIAASYLEAANGVKFRSADKKTIGYVDHGYVRCEKLALDFLRDKHGYNIIRLGQGSDIVNYINNRPVELNNGRREKTLIQDVAFFSHGLPGRIALNYNASPEIDFTEDELSSTRTDAFVPDGHIYSYACRTGIGHTNWIEDYENDAEAKPEDSLAQKMADHFRVGVDAFLRRTFYGDVLREKSDSPRIAAALKTARITDEGKIIEIPPEHEGLPHPGLADRRAAKKEGTNEYALWRRGGGRELPRAADTPKGVSALMRSFTPR